MDGLVSLADSSLRRRSLQIADILKPWLPYGFLGFLVLLVLAGISPHHQPLPSTDSSVFLYIADRILEGELPYRDIWDHKGPLIYYLNALGLLLADGSRWGVWLLELLFVGAAAWLGFRLMLEIFGFYPALIASTIWLVALGDVVDLGNLTEEYALIFQFGALWFFWRAVGTREAPNYWGAGAMTAMAFLLRPNLIGVGLGIGFYLLLDFARVRTWEKGRRLLGLAGGFLVPVAVVTTYFGLNGALPDLWDQVFHYNFIYSNTNWHDRAEVFFFGIDRLGLLAWLGLAGWLTVLSLGDRNKGSRHDFLYAALWIFPLEWLLVALPGNQFSHYLMTLLPILAIFSGLLLSKLLQPFLGHTKRALGLSLLLASLVLPLGNHWPPTWAMAQSALINGGVPIVDISTEQGLYEAIGYLGLHSASEEPVLFLGNHATLNWFTKHPSPTRYVYQSALFNDEYRRPEMVDELLGDILGSQALIVDTHGAHAFLGEIEADLETIPEFIRPIYAYIQENYILVEELSLTQWRVYEYTGPQ